MTSGSKTTDALKDGDLEGSARAAASAVSDMAHDATETAKARIDATATDTKNTLAGEMKDTAAALRRAAEEVRDGSPQGTTFSYLADGLADMADSVKGQDVSDMFGIVNTFARKNPVAFLGGAALLGFAATRFAKASDHGHHQDTMGRTPSTLPQTRAQNTVVRPATTATAPTAQGGIDNG